MRILYHHRTQAEDAQGIHIYEMVKAFRDLGHEVDVVALVHGERAPRPRASGASLRALKQLAPDWLYELMTLAYNVYGYRSLSRAIRLKRPDLIYERYSLNTFCGIWASRHFGIPLVLEVNAPLFFEETQLGKLAFKRLARFSERWICSHSTWTVVVSKVMEEILLREGVEPQRIIVMANGIDPERFNPAISGEEVRKRYGLDGKVVVGFVGWFRKWHGLEMLLTIAQEFLRTGRSIRLLLVGDGPAYRDLYRHAERQALLQEVIFTGPVRRGEVAAHISAMEIAVQASATEYACPIKILEYMAMKKCIVAPDQPNIREILKNKVSAFLFRPGDSESFRQILLELLDNPTKRVAAGENAYASLLERGLLWKKNAERVLSLLPEAQPERSPTEVEL